VFYRESGEVVEIDWEVEGDDLDMDAVSIWVLVLC